MSNSYLDEDYTIKLFQHNEPQYSRTEATTTTTTTTETTEEETVVQTVDYHSYVSSTGSNPPNNVFFANTNNVSSVFTAGSNVHNDTFGQSIYISGNYAAVGVHLNVENLVNNDNYSGVVLLHSGSNGWKTQQHISVTSSLMPENHIGVKQVSDFAKSWSYDRKNGKHIAIAVPMRAAGATASQAIDKAFDGKVFIFTSGSSGFEHVQTITSASLPDSIKNHFTISNPDAAGQYYTPGYHYWASSVRVDGDLLSIGSLERRNVPKSEWDNPSLVSSTHCASPGVVVFKSSSSGFVYDAFLDGFDIAIGTSEGQLYAMDNNASHDLKDGTCVFAGNGGFGTTSWTAGTGRIRVWKTSSSGWVNEGSLDLFNLGFTSSWSSVIGSENYPSTFDSLMDDFPTWPSISRPAGAFYYHFGRAGLAVSDGTIVATAQARTNQGYFDKRLSNRIFIIESGSTGWELATSFKSPNTSAEGPDDTNSTYDEMFGIGGLAIDKGTIVVKAPNSRINMHSTQITPTYPTGRSYIFNSSSESGWQFDIPIHNPYSGSAIYDIAQFGANRGSFGLESNSLNGFYVANVGPAVGGPSDEVQHIILPYSGIDVGNSGEAIKGAVYILKGTPSFRDETITTQTTTTTTTETVTLTEVEGGPMPFRFSSNGAFNIRKQNSGGSSYITFIGEDKT